jgi:hypothetical protein
LIQIATGLVLDGKDANEKLRIFQNENPQREIIGVSMCPATTNSWFMTITYKIERK